MRHLPGHMRGRYLYKREHILLVVVNRGFANACVDIYFIFLLELCLVVSEVYGAFANTCIYIYIAVDFTVEIHLAGACIEVDTACNSIIYLDIACACIDFQCLIAVEVIYADLTRACLDVRLYAIQVINGYLACAAAYLERLILFIGEIYLCIYLVIFSVEKILPVKAKTKTGA